MSELLEDEELELESEESELELEADSLDAPPAVFPVAPDETTPSAPV